MPLTYFTNFKQSPYSNSAAVDITERVMVSNNTLKNPFLFYPVELNEGIRPDNLAYAAYGDPYASWVIYLCNNILDPYYEWYLTTDQFNNYITKKYGSVPLSQQKVKYFQNNWVDQPGISIAAYNALTSNQMGYWEPNLNQYGSPIDYVRKQTDWTSTTNYILNLGVTGNTTTFINDEVVQISYGPGSNGQAQVIQAGNNYLIVQHIFNNAFPNGNVVISNTSYCYGTESEANVLITSCAFISNNIPEDTYVYWSPVYYYDDENATNEGNKVVQMLQPQFLNAFIGDVQTLLSSNGGI
jgi:hypothetical protein